MGVLRTMQGNRTICFCSTPLKGSFTCREFAIHPIPPDWPQPPMLVAHHPLILEVLSEEQDVEEEPQLRSAAEEDQKATFQEGMKRFASAFRKSLEAMWLLTALTRADFFNYDHIGVHCWINDILGSTQPPPLVFGQAGYIYEQALAPTSTTELPRSTSPNYFDPFEPVPPHDQLVLPANLEELLETYWNLEDRDAFLNACGLQHHAMRIRKFSNSIAFTTMVTSLETLMQIDFKGQKPSICKECKAPIYRIGSRFKDFLATYAGLGKEHKKYVDKIYSLRSKIVHEGKLLEADKFILWDASSKDTEIAQEVDSMLQVAKLGIVSWLCAQVPVADTGGTDTTV